MVSAPRPATQRRQLAAVRSLVRKVNPAVVGSVLVLLVAAACALFAPALAPHSPTQRVISQRLQPPMTKTPAGTFVLGTDAVGRDVLSRMIHGARPTLLVGLAAVLLAGSVGVLLGLVAGYFGGWRDALIMRVVDLQLALPFIVLAIVVAGLLGKSLGNVILVLGLTGWVEYARVVRATTAGLRRAEFVEAATALGARSGRIVLRQILPNSLGSIIVLATLMVAKMMLAEASLSFLGLGVPASMATWGLMIAEGRDYLITAWWICAFPGLAILLLVLSVNVLGDWLNESLGRSSDG